MTSLCPDIPTLNDVVTGYHATSVQNASIIVNTQQFKIHNNLWDWLGWGIYFWKNDKQRARYWALDQEKKTNYTEKYAVVEAKIKLGLCLSLLGTTFDKLLEISYVSMKAECDGAGKTLPKNCMSGRYDLECAIHNYAVSKYAPQVQTIEKYFEEGEPIYCGAVKRHLSSVQLCVRDPNCIVSPITISMDC